MTSEAFSGGESLWRLFREEAVIAAGLIAVLGLAIVL